MVYLYYISCLRYTILVGNPRFIVPHIVFVPSRVLFTELWGGLAACRFTFLYQCGYLVLLAEQLASQVMAMCTCVDYFHSFDS